MCCTYVGDKIYENHIGKFQFTFVVLFVFSINFTEPQVIRDKGCDRMRHIDDACMDLVRITNKL